MEKTYYINEQYKIHVDVTEKINKIKDDFIVSNEIFGIKIPENKTLGKLMYKGKEYNDNTIVKMTSNTNVQNRGVIIVTERYRQHQQNKFIECIRKFHKDITIVIIHQNNDNIFNKSMLNNICKTLLDKEYGKNYFNYIIFIDIDMFPKNNFDISYVNYLAQFCGKLYEYKKRDNSKAFSGGIIIINSEIFDNINGYDNDYIGWGYEDKDLLKRFYNKYDIISTIRYCDFICPKNNSDKIYKEENFIRFQNTNLNIKGINNLRYTDNLEYPYDYKLCYKTYDSTLNIIEYYVDFIDIKNERMSNYNDICREKYKKYHTLINTTNIPLNDTNFFCKVYNYKNINEMNNCHYSALKLNNGNIDFPLVNSITIDNYSNIYEQIYKTLIMLYLRKINYDKDKIITNKDNINIINDHIPYLQKEIKKIFPILIKEEEPIIGIYGDNILNFHKNSINYVKLINKYNNYNYILNDYKINCKYIITSNIKIIDLYKFLDINKNIIYPYEIYNNINIKGFIGVSTISPIKKNKHIKADVYVEKNLKIINKVHKIGITDYKIIKINNQNIINILKHTKKDIIIF